MFDPEPSPISGDDFRISGGISGDSILINVLSRS